MSFNIRRVLFPHQGRYLEVVNDLLNLKKSNEKFKQHSILSSLAVPFQNDRHITVNIVLNSATDVEEYLENIYPQFVKDIAEINAKCTNIKSGVFKLIEGLENPEAAKFFLRRVIIAKHGKRAELIKLLREIRSAMDGSSKPGILIPMGGSSDLVQLGRQLENFEAVDSIFENGLSEEGAENRARMAELSESNMTSIHRIVSRANQ
tara:strand:+ start:235 stop:852 length:618 start_codon:yes stop_codon:yes gene_type:complete